MQPEASTRQVSEGEFNALELWRAIVRRRLWFIAGLAGCLIAGGVYLAVKSPVYEARIKMRIGQAAGAGPFESADVLASRLIAEYGENVADGVRRPPPYLTRAIAAKGGVPVVDLAAEGVKPEDAAEFLNRVFGEVAERHGAVYQRNVASLKERFEAIDGQRAALQRQHAEASALAARLRQANPVEAALVALEVSGIAEAITSIDRDMLVWARELTPPRTEPTVLLGQVSPPVRPSAPRFGLVLATASVAGLLIGLLFVFIAEFVARFRDGMGRA